MRRIIFGMILVGIAVSAVAQMLTQPSAESDALFAAGVDLYNKGKYREAIPLFAKSDSLDNAQIDPTSNRLGYSRAWLASCYYMLGDTSEALKYSFYYDLSPVDRRLTVVSDTLGLKGVGYFNVSDYNNALNCFERQVEIEKSLLGDKHIFYGNTVSLISECYFRLNDTLNFLKYDKFYVDILGCNFGKQSEIYVAEMENLGLSYHKHALYENALNCFIELYDNLNDINPERRYLAYLIAGEYATISRKYQGEKQIDCLLNARSYLKNADLNELESKHCILMWKKRLLRVFHIMQI